MGGIASVPVKDDNCEVKEMLMLGDFSSKGTIPVRFGDGVTQWEFSSLPYGCVRCRVPFSAYRIIISLQLFLQLFLFSLFAFCCLHFSFLLTTRAQRPWISQ